MNIVAVDLAAKFSAACWMTNSRQALLQCDSWKQPEHWFVFAVTRPWAYPSGGVPDALVVEDLPPRVPWMTVVKDVCRLQGRIIDRMDGLGFLHRVLFVQPAQWKGHYGADLKQGTGPGAVVPVAASFGYTAPDLSARTGKGEKATARKVATDYCAAYLIGRWAIDMYEQHGTLDVPRTSRYRDT